MCILVCCNVNPFYNTIQPHNLCFSDYTYTLSVTNGGTFGDWTYQEFCTKGHYAIGYKMKVCIFFVGFYILRVLVDVKRKNTLHGVVERTVLFIDKQII